MTTIELGTIEVVEVDGEEVEDFICHLYPAGGQVAFCGLHSSKDEHCLMHQGYGQRSPEFGDEGPGTGCPACGATICPTCEREVT